MKISSIFENPKPVVNTNVVIEGKLVITPSESCIVEPEANPEHPYKKITVKEPDLIKKCLAKVPSLVGGKYYYISKVIIKGKLIETRENEYQLINLSSIQFYDADEIYQVLFP